MKLYVLRTKIFDQFSVESQLQEFLRLQMLDVHGNILEGETWLKLCDIKFPYTVAPSICKIFTLEYWQQVPYNLYFTIKYPINQYLGVPLVCPPSLYVIIHILAFFVNVIRTSSLGLKNGWSTYEPRFQTGGQEMCLLYVLCSVGSSL